MSPAKKKALIRRDHPNLSISQQCRLVRLSRSAFYYAPVGIDAVTLAPMKAIDRVFTKYPFFGSRQIAAYLRRDGIVAGRHRVRRLMAKMGLEANYLEELTDGFQTHRVIRNRIAFYNTERPHSSLERRTPKEAFWTGRDEKLTA